MDVNRIVEIRIGLNPTAMSKELGLIFIIMHIIVIGNCTSFCSNVTIVATTKIVTIVSVVRYIK